jgi:hypothetical protein
MPENVVAVSAGGDIAEPSLLAILSGFYRTIFNFATPSDIKMKL